MAGGRPDMSYSKRPNRGQGMKCPECGCTDLRAYGTRHLGNRTIRYRRCRNCGHGPIMTHEEIRQER